MKNKRILITGIAGSIGSELARQLCKRNKVYGCDINETGIMDLRNEIPISARVGDIRNPVTVNDIFSDFKPQIVFHAAAYKHVSPMEEIPRESIDANVIGTHNVLHYSGIYPVKKFIYISSDKAVNATSVMGITKRLGEVMTCNRGKGYVAVRFGNVLGSSGSVIPIWERQLNKGTPLSVTSAEAERYFMTIEDAVELVIKAGNDGKGGEIYILDMGKPVQILELAKRIAKELKGDTEITGLRHGEVLTEKLMTEEEEKRARKEGKFWII
jgi:FlaA1/EpsC-like NDP-sugar epimerase